jgi:thioredoxin-related protein
MSKLLIKLGLLVVVSIVYSSCKNNSDTHTAESTIKGTKQSPIATNGNSPSATDDHLNTGGLIWTTFDALPENKSDKKYLVDIYTEWCGWCKVMDKKTFTDPKVQEYLNDNFHLIKFDAEQKESITYKDKVYEWQAGSRNGYNTLAKELLGGRMSYPTMVYLDKNLNKITAIPGYKKPDQLLAELKAINEGT